MIAGGLISTASHVLLLIRVRVVGRVGGFEPCLAKFSTYPALYIFTPSPGGEYKYRGVLVIYYTGRGFWPQVVFRNENA